MFDSDIPRELVKRVVDDQVTLFVGAGLSVDIGLPDWNTLIRPLAHELGISSAQPPLDIIESYAAQIGGKNLLLQYIMRETDITGKAPGDNHRRLARLGVRNWITTNYDNLLEETLKEAHQRYDLVYKDSNLTMTRNNGVILLKLHGAREDPDSLVITEEQYNNWECENTLVYNQLTGLLTTTHLLFLGYSLRDPDLKRAQDHVFKKVGPLMRPSYGVFFDLSDVDVRKLEARNIRVINLRLSGTEPSVLLGIWLQDLVRQVDLERSRRPGKGQLPTAVKKLYEADPPSLHDHASYLADIRKAIISRHDGEFLEIYSESGRGKSRLLLEAMAEVSSRYPQALLLYSDLATLIDSASEQRPLAAVRELIKVAGGRLMGESTTPDELVASVLAQLQSYSEAPVCLIFDTTEALQDDYDFWRWLEANLVTPILDAKSAALIFAGRSLVRWSQECYRRRRMSLERFEQGYPFQRLAQDELIRRDANKLSALQREQAQQLALQLSFQHPGICVQLSSYLARNGLTGGFDTTKTTLGREVLRPFVDEVLLADKDQKSRRILTLVSVLDRYDPYSVLAFLQEADPSAEYTDYDVLKAFRGDFSSRRSDERISYRSGGYTSSSELQTIVRQSLELNDPDLYRRAMVAKRSISGIVSMEDGR